MANAQKRPINLLKGWPNASLLPTSLMKEAAAVALSDPQSSISGLSYAPDWGYEPLRSELAKWLSDFYGPRFAVQPAPPIVPERLCVSGGASQNLACVLQAYTDPIYTLVPSIYHSSNPR
jgi:DNA-binding transcriptional MocR family regulator